MRKDQIFSVPAATAVFALVWDSDGRSVRLPATINTSTWIADVKGELTRELRRGGAVVDRHDSRLLRFPDQDQAAEWYNEVHLPRTEGRDDWGYFPTPEAVATILLDAVNWNALPVEGWILEPSAGSGHLALEILEYLNFQARHDLGLHATELNADRYTFLSRMLLAEAEKLGVPAALLPQRDFLDYDPTSTERRYDLIVMNPPFSTPVDKLAYITHLYHAWAWLAPGGQLVAVAPAGFDRHSQKRVKEFNNFVCRHGTWEGLPADSFKESGTGAAAVWLRLTKPAESAAAPPPDPHAVIESMRSTLDLHSDADTPAAVPILAALAAQTVQTAADAEPAPPDLSDPAAARAALAAALGLDPAGPMPPQEVRARALQRGVNLAAYAATAVAQKALLLESQARAAELAAWEADASALAASTAASLAAHTPAPGAVLPRLGTGRKPSKPADADPEADLRRLYAWWQEHRKADRATERAAYDVYARAWFAHHFPHAVAPKPRVKP